MTLQAIEPKLPSILFIDDDQEIVDSFRSTAGLVGEFTAITASSSVEALEIAAKTRFDVVVCDYLMPETNGIQLFKIFRAKYSDLPFIIFSGAVDEATVGEMTDDPLFYFVPKGGDFGRLVYEIKDATVQKVKRDLQINHLKKLNLLNGITLHDLRNNDTSLNGWIGLILAAIAEGKDLQKMKDDITVYCKKQERVLSSNAMLREESDAFHQVDTAETQPTLLSKAIIKLTKNHPELVFVNDIPEDIEIYVDASSFLRIGEVLIDNSKRHGQRVSGVQFSFYKEGNYARFVYEDNGVGVVPENKEKIFGRGFGGNTGLGLYLAREIMLIFGGTIIETGEFGRNARFEILIPFCMYRRGPDCLDEY